MAMNDNYRLNISGDSRDLEQSLQTIIAMMDAIEERDLGKSVEGFGNKLREIAQLTKEVQDISSKNEGGSFVSSKDMNETIKSTREATKLIQEFQKALQDVQNQRISDGMAPDEQVIKTHEKLGQVIDSNKDKMESMASTNIGKDGSLNALIKDMERLGTLTDEYYSSVDKATGAQERLSQVRATRNRVQRNLEKSEISGRMSYDQGVQTQQALNSVKTMKSDRERFSQDIGKTRESFIGAKSQQKDLATKYSEGKLDRKEYETERAKIEATVKAREKELHTMEKLQKELDKTINYFEGSAQQEMGTRTQDAQRGTFTRMMQERAPSIGSHAVMAGMGVGVGMYAHGKSMSETNRPYTVALGQQMGESDYGNLRQTFSDDAIENKLGLNSTDMLQLADQFNSSAGYTNTDTTRDATVELGTGMRSMGIANSEAYKESMASLIHTGGANDALEIKDMQSAFIGGLKESGMVGRNEEQLKALTTIAEQNSQGRTLSKDELSMISATQSTLAGTGSKALQGEQGAQFMTGIDQGLKNASDNAYTRQILGWGTEYQGYVGDYEFNKQAEKGITDPDNLKSFYDVANTQGGTEQEKKALFFKNLENLNPETTTEQSDELFGLMKDGDLSTEELKKKIKDLEEKGSEERDKNSKDYKESDAGKNDQGKAKVDDLAERLYDLVQPVRDAHNALTGLPAPLYILGASAIALAASFAKSMAMMKGGEMIGRGTRGYQNRRAGRTNRPPSAGGSSSRGNRPTSTQSRNARGGSTTTGGSRGGGLGRMMTGVGGLFGFDILGDMLDSSGKNTGTKGKSSSGGGMVDINTFEKNEKEGKRGRGRFRGLGGALTGLGGKAKDMFGKVREAGGQQPGGKGVVGNTVKKAGGFVKDLGKNIWGRAKDPTPGGMNKTNGFMSGATKGAGKGILKKVPYLGAGLMLGESAMRMSKGENGNEVLGDQAGAFIDPFNMGYGQKIGDHLTKTAKKSEDNPLGISWGKWEKGKRGVVGNAVTDAWDGVKNLFGGSKNKKDSSKKKDSKTKGGGGGGQGAFVTPNEEGLGLTKNINGEIPSLKAQNESLGKHAGSPLVPGKEESRLKDNVAIDSTDDKAKKKNKVTGTDKPTPMKSRMDAERLREKNNTSETENLQVYRGLLDRFEQLIQEAKSLDIKGGGSEDSDSDSDGGKSAGEITGSGSKKIWNFFKDKGLKDHQIAGIMGNLQQESGLDPTNENAETGAYGIAQWAFDRKKELQNYAKSKGTKASDLDTQLDFLWKELKGSENSAYKHLLGTKNVGDATTSFATKYERMGEHEAMMGTRKSNADKFKEKYGGGGSGGFGESPEVLTKPLETYSTNTTNSTDNTTNHNNNVNINVTVEGGGDPEETGNVVGDAIASRISSLDIFSNQQKRK